MLENRVTFVEQFSAQMNQLSYAPPSENQSFYQDTLNKNKPIEFSITREDTNYFINHETALLAVLKKE